MTSNLASEEIRAASPVLRALVDQTENRHQQYLQVIGKFNRQIHPVLKRALKRDEFLGRINQIVVFLPLDESEVHAYKIPLTFEI
jgi:ATP-dependent Clp protease ATP-binding subunit ClpB